MVVACHLIVRWGQHWWSSSSFTSHLLIIGEITMVKEIKVTYSEALIKKTAQRFAGRLMGRSGLMAFVGALLLFVYFVASGDRSWLTGALGAVAALAFVVLPLLYLSYLRRSLAAFRTKGISTAIFRFTDDELVSETALGSSAIKWEAIEEIWQFPEVWLLFWAKWQCITLPTASLDEETRHFVLSKVEERD